MPPGLSERAAHPDPIAQFRRWYAVARGATWSDAMTLATASRGASPAARAVLLRGVEERGFVFFTDYRSRKARELRANSRAALVFLWAGQRRQVRVEGTVARLSPAESDAYFRSRPRGSRLAVWASEQSRPIAGGRAALDARYRAAVARFRGRPVPRPPYWGGYRLTPDRFEFWQGRANRLHDRLSYARRRDGSWRRERLMP